MESPEKPGRSTLPRWVRKGACYTQRDVEQLVLVRKWQLAGLSLEQIGELLKQQDTAPDLQRRNTPGTVEVWSPLFVADGVELTLEPGRAGLTPERVRTFFRAATQTYAQIHKSEEE